MDIKQELTNAIETNLHALKKRGYIFMGVTTPSSQSIGEYFIVTLQAIELDRRLSIMYSPKNESAITNIEKLSNKFDFSDSGSVQITGISIDEFEGCFSEKFTGYLKELELRLMAEYADIINGLEYESDPFDWSAYR